MTAPVYCLVYMSNTTGAMSAEDLLGLLDTCRRNNARAGLSGILLFQNDLFLQVLEGPRDRVEETYARIAADSRHCRLTLLSRGERARRAFADWSMGFRRLGGGKDEALPEAFTRYLDDGVPPAAASDAAFLFGYLERFRNTAPGP